MFKNGASEFKIFPNFCVVRILSRIICYTTTLNGVKMYSLTLGSIHIAYNVESLVVGSALETLSQQSDTLSVYNGVTVR